MILFFKNVLRFSAAWFIAALLNTVILTCFFLYRQGGYNNVTGFSGLFFYSMAAGFFPQVMLGLTTLSTEGFGKTGIPLFRFVLRATIIIWSVWMIILVKVFDSFYEPYAPVFFSIQLSCAVIAIFFFRTSIIKS